MPAARRFPPPWTIEEANAACFIVRDSTGQALGYFYFEEEPGRRSAAKLLTRDEGSADGGQLRQAAGATAPTGAIQVSPGAIALRRSDMSGVGGKPEVPGARPK